MTNPNLPRWFDTPVMMPFGSKSAPGPGIVVLLDFQQGVDGDRFPVDDQVEVG